MSKVCFSNYDGCFGIKNGQTYIKKYSNCTYEDFLNAVENAKYFAFEGFSPKVIDVNEKSQIITFQRVNVFGKEIPEFFVKNKISARIIEGAIRDLIDKLHCLPYEDYTWGKGWFHGDLKLKNIGWITDSNCYLGFRIFILNTETMSKIRIGWTPSLEEWCEKREFQGSFNDLVDSDYFMWNSKWLNFSSLMENPKN